MNREEEERLPLEHVTRGLVKKQQIERLGVCSSVVVFNLFSLRTPYVIPLYLCTPKIVDVQFKLYIVYTLHLKQRREMALPNWMSLTSGLLWFPLNLGLIIQRIYFFFSILRTPG
jgi:hypothetical protein